MYKVIESPQNRPQTHLSKLAILAVTLAALARPAQSSTPAPSPIGWEPWSDAVFERAKQENRLVLLDLEAVWCHWCHVMDDVTYRDPEVVELIRKHVIAVRVDQDSRPDLSNRYEDYGWPATILFDSKGRELAKRSGYIPPRPMASMLQAFIEDPTPGPSVLNEEKGPSPGADGPPTTGVLPDALRKELLSIHRESYDRERGGWGFSHKYLDWQSVEYCLERARAGDTEASRMARQTLDAQRALIDPVWGGVYQYSTGGNWNEPHFEKLVQFQAENLRIYSLAWLLWKEPAYLEAAKAIHHYLVGFLKSPEGAFYVSQDADLVPGQHSAGYFALGDSDRRKRGVPRVDANVYSRENGWVIRALVTYYAASGDPKILSEAVRAADWVLANRALPGGGFRHGARDTAGPFLGDTLAMGQAFLSLHGATGDRRWLARAEESMGFVSRRFRSGNRIGVLTAASPKAATEAVAPRPQRDENIGVARFGTLLAEFSGKPLSREIAREALAFLAQATVARGRPVGGVLLADLDASRPPLHITIVGGKAETDAKELFQAAGALPTAYKRVEWWDPKEGPLPNADVEYPSLGKAAAFACTEGRCSAPIFKARELRTKVERLLGL